MSESGQEEGELELPYIRGMELGTLFSSQTCRTAPPSQRPSSRNPRLSQPRTWRRWTVVSSGLDLYRALHVPYPMALKVLTEQTDEMDLPLGKLRRALASPNCRGLLFLAGEETGERIVDKSPARETLDTMLDNQISHYVHRLVKGKQLVILLTISTNDEIDGALVDNFLQSASAEIDENKLVFTALDTILKKETVEACFLVHPDSFCQNVRTIARVLEMMSQFPSKTGSREETTRPDDSASLPVTSFTRCYLKLHPSKPRCSDSEEAVCGVELDDEALKMFDELFCSCLRAKQKLINQPLANYRMYQREALEKRRREMLKVERSFEEVVEKLCVFEASENSAIEKAIKTHENRDFEFESDKFIENLEFMLRPSPLPLNILLLGKAGHGKSSTGNSILRQDVFKSSGDTRGTTNRCEVRMADTDGRIFRVVDTPGIMDPSNPKEAMSEICNAIACSPEGFQAVLIIWRYGIKMTPEEVKTIELLKRIFGKNLLEDHTVFALTHGDQFEAAMRNEGRNISFEKWKEDQKEKDSNFGKIVTDCHERCLLFDNATREKKKRKKQLFELVDVLEEMLQKKKNAVLQNEYFQLAKENLEKEILAHRQEEEARAEKERELKETIDYIDRKAEKLKPQERETIEEKLANLRGIQLSLITSLTTRDNYLAKAMQDVRDLRRQVDSKADAVDVDEDLGEEQRSLGRSDASLTASEVRVRIDRAEQDARPLLEAGHARSAVVGERTAEQSSTVCFPANATVQLQDGRRVQMTSLRVGDVVLCGKEDGSLAYSAVYMFGHREEFSPLHCVALATRSATLRLSHGHLVFRRHLGRVDTVPAGDVGPGDEMAVFQRGSPTLQWEPVTGVESRWETGVMAPFTLEGAVVVDDVLASCYVAVTSHGLCHALLWPIRKLAVLAPSLSRRLHRSGERGIPGWVELCLRHLVPWLPGQSLKSE